MHRSQAKTAEASGSEAPSPPCSRLSLLPLPAVRKFEPPVVGVPPAPPPALPLLHLCSFTVTLLVSGKPRRAA